MPETEPTPDDSRDPLEALAYVACPHTRHYAMCARCAVAAIRPEVERLLARVAELEATPVDWDAQRRRADVLEVTVERLRGQLGEASDALRAVGKAALTVAPTLREPYRDAPETSPWKRFMEQPARRAYDLGVRIRRELKERS